jgi:hypothetical protein
VRGVAQPEVGIRAGSGLIFVGSGWAWASYIRLGFLRT